ncbi:MAG: hypothetical protein WBJ03_08550 [Moraxellaceae bacterium]
MNARHLRFLVPLILLAYLLAQNGLVLAQLAGALSGHQIVSNWHGGHYDVVMAHGTDSAPVTADDGCQVSCSDHHHIDIKPADPVTPDAKSKSLLGLLLALTPVLLIWLLPLVRRQPIRWPRLLHRNSLPLLIRSTVLRH